MSEDNKHAKCEAVMPIINLTPITPIPRLTTSSLLAPKPDDLDKISAELCPPISFKECTFVKCENGLTLFDISFLVSGEQHAVITRRLAINNAAFMDEAKSNVVPTIFIEEPKEQKIAEEVAKRMRELAGIPHRKNFL